MPRLWYTGNCHAQWLCHCARLHIPHLCLQVVLLQACKPTYLTVCCCVRASAVQIEGPRVQLVGMAAIAWCCAHAPYTSCFWCLQAHRTIDSNVSLYLSLHDCLRGLGAVLKQLTGILLEEVPMLPGEPAITPKVSLQSPQDSHCMSVTCSRVHVDLQVMMK